MNKRGQVHVRFWFGLYRHIQFMKIANRQSPCNSCLWGKKHNRFQSTLHDNSNFGAEINFSILHAAQPRAHDHNKWRESNYDTRAIWFPFAHDLFQFSKMMKCSGLHQIFLHNSVYIQMNSVILCKYCGRWWNREDTFRRHGTHTASPCVRD